MKKRDAVCLGDIYGKMLNTFKYNLKECNDNAFGKTPELIGDGPETDGYNKALNDEEEEMNEEDEESYKKTKGEKIGEFYSSKKPKQNEDSDDEVEDSDDVKRDAIWNKNKKDSKYDLKESKKITTTRLNKFMSKSVFDKLYSKVLKENFGQDEGNDLGALGLDDATPDSNLDDDFGGEDEFGTEDEGDTVTFTLDRATAQTLIDVLQGAIGEGEGEGEAEGDDFGDDLDFEDEGDGEGDDFGDFEEDEETQGTKTAPDKKKAFQGKDNKVSGPPTPKKKKASGDVTDEVGTKTGAPSFKHLQAQNNQVNSSIKKAADYFQ